jgi:hypothetical protein
MGVEAVKAGQVIAIPQIPDRRLGQVEVKTSCGKNNGHWYCVVHKEHLQNNFMKDTHIAKGNHILAWICHEHGAEEP